MLLLAGPLLFAQPPTDSTVEQLEQRLRAEPSSQAVKRELAEAYLHDCRLDQALTLFRDIASADPADQRAKRVVERLTAQVMDLDGYLAVLDGLIDKGATVGIEPLLDQAGQRAATDPQKAQILYLRGRLSLGTAADAQGRAAMESAMRLYPHTPGAARAAIALAVCEQPDGGDLDRARRLLRGVIDDKQMPDEAVRQQARFRLVVAETLHLTASEKIAALRDLLGRLTDGQARRDALGELISTMTVVHGRWTPEAIDALGQVLATEPPPEQALGVLADLLEAAYSSEDAATLDRLIGLLGSAAWSDPAHARGARFVLVDATLARAVVEDDPNVMRALLARAGRVLDALADGRTVYPDRLRVTQLRGRSLLIEGQKLGVLRGADAALPVLLAARDHYLEAMDSDPEECFGRLGAIGRLLEQLGEWETAVGLYRQIAARFPHLPQGRDALLRAARLCEGELDSPLEALEVYAEYAARYPAELPYRQLGIGERLRRLGYANVLDFQRRNNLKTDGLVGPATRSRLAELEASFDLIRAGAQGDGGAEEILRGQFVHPRMFAIAQRLERAGRHRDAIGAYRLFVNLFPTKAQANHCLLAVARLFRDNLLFAEAMGAYRQVMEDYPDGDQTSEAYVEAAQCLENLGQWAQARELYELYTRKFPKYPHVALCRTRIELLDQIVQYDEFIRTHPDSPKVAEAQYQIAALLYRHFGNHTKSAVEFAKVAERHPGHVRAPDALFTAGTAQLRAENFPAARALFAELVERYPQSRLADDGQYWIGHSYEYAARALGRLDRARIVLRRRALGGRADLLGDLELRRHYDPRAAAGEGPLPPEVWGGTASDALGVLTSGSRRDRVNADLHRAIAAYRKVVDQFRMGDMAGNALLRIGTIYTEYLNDPDAGVAAFEELLTHYPGSREAVDALFEVGAHQVRRGKFDQAIQSYQQFIYNYPNESKVQDAMVAVARCHAETRAWDKALDAWQSYLTKFPQGRFADQARAQVEWIRMYHF